MILQGTKRSIFRSRAIEHYIQSQERAVLPYSASPWMPAIMWLLLVLLIAMVVAIWWQKVPVYTLSPGILQSDNSSASLRQKKMVAVVFLPAHHSLQLLPGSPTQLQIVTGTKSIVLAGQIERIAPGTDSPQELHNRYHLNNVATALVTQPSITVLIRVISPAQALSLYTGSIVKAQVQTGEQSLLSLLLSAMR